MRTNCVTVVYPICHVLSVASYLYNQKLVSVPQFFKQKAWLVFAQYCIMAMSHEVAGTDDLGCAEQQ